MRNHDQKKIFFNNRKKSDFRPSGYIPVTHKGIFSRERFANDGNILPGKDTTINVYDNQAG